jgi:hypothetical protein
MPRKIALEKLIQSLAKDSKRISFTFHCLSRMKERQITRMLVFDVLERGLIKREPEIDVVTGHLKCRMERFVAGRELAIVVAVESDSATTGVVVTAIDIRRMK